MRVCLLCAAAVVEGNDIQGESKFVTPTLPKPVKRKSRPEALFHAPLSVAPELRKIHPVLVLPAPFPTSTSGYQRFVMPRRAEEQKLPLTGW